LNPILDAILKPVTDIINKVVPDTAAKQAAQAELQKLALQGSLQSELTQLLAVTSAQTDINKVEAASTNLFVSGWRPFIGWICGVGLGMSCIVGPLFTWIAALSGHPTPFPAFDDPLLRSTLAGMLGLGFGLRTYEKVKGVAAK